MHPMEPRNRLKYFTFRRMVLRFFYPLWVLFSSKRKVDNINENSILAVKESGGIVTILLHGIFTNYYTALYWAIRWFKLHGIQVVSIGYDYGEPIEKAAKQVKKQIDAVLARTGGKKINLVGLSMGGSVAHYYVEKLEGKEVVDKLVTVFSPLGNLQSFSIAYIMTYLISPRDAARSKKQGERVAHSFSAKNHLAIYGVSDWVVGPKAYPIPDAPASFTQVPIAGGHLFVSYNTDALELALEYLLEMPPESQMKK